VTGQAIALLAPGIGTRAACAASGVAQASWYRRHRASPAPLRRAPVPHRDRVQPRALAPAERAAILGALHAERFAGTAPAEAWATLLDEGTYPGSLSTFCRLLRAAGETRERRAQATHPAAVKPELIADGPNQVWSWDITKLHGPAKWTYYYLYVILDIYSRYAVGWMVATRESAALAEKLIAATMAKQDIGRGQLTIHADRGSSMTSKR
jgi:putative transposase